MFDLKAARQRIGVTQSEMATAMGMPLRSYQDIEAGKNPVRPIHETAASMASIRLAVQKKNADLLSMEAFNLVSKANNLIERMLADGNKKPAS